MAPILRKRGGGWIGWTGAAGNAPRPFVHDGIRIRAVPLSHGEIDNFYLGFSNATLWPLYHDALRTPVFHRKWWTPYVEINRRFARVAARVARRNQIVWIHDYQLQLVPRFLRALRPDLRIGFFLHIPFPPDELFAWLPWRRELLEGLLGADVLGFQTHADAQDFSRAARQFTSADGTESRLQFRNREIHVREFPISIDYHDVERIAADPVTQRAAQELRKRLGLNRKILLAVDRLDYTKGIDTRLLAFEELLRRGKRTVDDCVLLQIAVPSRESVTEYRDLRSRVEGIVGRINGDFSVPGRVAVHYFRRSLSTQELVEYYLAADVMLVTPLRDGMNLVAKEYVASRTDNSGVLVLSEFAGAALELRQAVLVNPRDTEGMVRAMHTAMTLPRAQARFRMSILRTIVRRHDVHFWANNFLEALES